MQYYTAENRATELLTALAFDEFFPSKTWLQISFCVYS